MNTPDSAEPPGTGRSHRRRTLPAVRALRSLAPLIMVAALTLAACGGGSDGEASGSRADRAPDFSGTTVDGQELISADYAGQDVILWFWAPW